MIHHCKLDIFPQSIFTMSNMDELVVVIANLKFADLCLLLDFVYLGESQVPPDRLDDFLKAGELLQIRGIKEGRIQYLNSLQQTTTVNRSFDATISSTQETLIEPRAKRAREENDFTVQEASEIMKVLLDNNADIDVDLQTQQQAKTIGVSLQGKPSSFFMTKNPIADKMRRSSSPPRSGRKNIPEKPKFLCRFCSRALTTQGRIKKHENECVDNPNREIAICDICNFQLKPSSLSLHKNSKHKSLTSLPPQLVPSTSKDSFNSDASQIEQMPIDNIPPPILFDELTKESLAKVEVLEIPACSSLFGLPMKINSKREFNIDPLVFAGPDLSPGSKQKDEEPPTKDVDEDEMKSPEQPQTLSQI